MCNSLFFQDSEPRNEQYKKKQQHYKTKFTRNAKVQLNNSPSNNEISNINQTIILTFFRLLYPVVNNNICQTSPLKVFKWNERSGLWKTKGLLERIFEPSFPFFFFVRSSRKKVNDMFDICTSWWLSKSASGTVSRRC